MKKNKCTIVCNKCNNSYNQEVYGIDDIDWVCPTCRSDDDTFLREYIYHKDNISNKKIILGNGGALHA